MSARRLTGLLLAMLVWSVASPARPDVAPAERARALAAAGAVLPEDSSLDPGGSLGAPPEYDAARQIVKTIEITYEPSSGSTGKTRKLWGRDPRGEEWKVKYGSKEVYTEVAATRLLRTMGYAADFPFPVRTLICRGCRDADPWKSMESSSAPPVPDRIVRIAPASIERSFHDVVEGAKKIEDHDDQGVRLDELDRLIAGLWETEPERAAELDSLKAVAFMLQNADTKADNQRLVRLASGDSVVMFQDVGSTFGRGKDRISRVVSKLDFPRWKKRLEEPWVADDALTLRLPRGMHAEGGWENPTISPEGLRFFLDRAARLDRETLVAAFRAARFPEATGVPAEEWAAAWERGIENLSARADR